MSVIITDANFKEEVLGSELLVFVDIYAEWCSPCKNLKPLLIGLEQNNSSVMKLGFLDVDFNPELTTQLKVVSIPKVVVFYKGEKIADLVGIQAKAKYQEILEKFAFAKI